MKADISLILIIRFSLSFAGIIERSDDDITFPEGFLLGAGTSAYQVEGGWNASDKGESYWDWISHNSPWTVIDRSNGDVAADSYHKYKEDVAILKNIGFDSYRFSLSWTRILPNGVANKVSEDGIKYYSDLIDELRTNGIEPFVTLYHFDHPQVLEKMGGWANELMVDWFTDYARVVFRELGPRVKYFTTINEPQELVGLPRFNRSKYEQYLSVHNILKAHAKAYHIYDKEFRPTQNGKLGIVMQTRYFYPEIEDDTETPDIGFQMEDGWVAHAIYSQDGDYPKVMRERIDENSKIQGWPRSKLPVFTKEEVEYIRGTADYYGLIFYYSSTILPVGKRDGEGWINDKGYVVGGWTPGENGKIQITPQGFEGVLRKIRDEYNNPEVYVLENGCSDSGNPDYDRIKYHYAYLKAMLAAMKDGCNVKGYSLWSLLDNFEWFRGYTAQYGIVSVDFDDSNRKRTLKASAEWFKEVLRTRKLISPEDYIH